jgi:hypothetical protein
LGGNENIRLDGRKPDEIRPIVCEIDPLPATHGSALFTRGETQSLTTVTLGTKLDEKIIDELSRYDLLTVFTRLDETSIVVKNTISDHFGRIGLELTDLRFEGIDTTPEYRERLFWLRTGRAAPEEVLRMETVKKAAEELKERVLSMLGNSEDLAISTFHSFAIKLSETTS